MKIWAKHNWKSVAIITLAVLAVEAIYLLNSNIVADENGYPVDDAWIHQVFARNLAQTGMLAFNPGTQSTGTTAPLWTGLIAVAYRFSLDPHAWTRFLGILFHWMTGLLVYGLGRKLIVPPHSSLFGLAAAIFVIAEWHLAWAALSGMETSFFIALSLLLVYLHLTRVSWTYQGLVAGLLTITRPEGILLFALVLVWGWRAEQRARLLGILLCVAVVAPFALYNLRVGGSVLPNTYSAKIADVENEPSASLLFLFEFSAMLVLGVGLLLIPFVSSVVQILREKNRALALPLAWIGGLAGLYTLFFPIAYNHMRYLMPVLPWIILIGVIGLARMSQRNPSRTVVHLAISAVVALALFTNGANVYAWNVENNNHQQVAVGEWIQSHTPPDSRIASIDIGAIGYFGQRQVVDLGGLITPDIVPFLRARISLAPYLCAHQVDYVVVFPPRYSDLSSAMALEEVYRRHLSLNTINPGSDLVIYAVRGCSLGSGSK